MPQENATLRRQVPRIKPGQSVDGTDNEDTGLIDSLSVPGLSGEDISKDDSLSPAAQSLENYGQIAPPDYGTEVSAQNTVSVFLAEEQEIFRASFIAAFKQRDSLTLVGSAHGVFSESLISAALQLRPQVMVVGVKGLQPATVETLERLHEACPDIALVLLFSYYSQRGMKCLREFSREASVGRAYLPKHTIDTMDQLEQTVHLVAEGRVIIDPSVMEGLFRTEGATAGTLKGLSPKALEVLKWVSKGYRNEAIADTLSRDTKTVERHINNIYTTLDTDNSGGLHPRVHAALTYLKAIGVIAAEYRDYRLSSCVGIRHFKSVMPRDERCRWV